MEARLSLPERAKPTTGGGGPWQFAPLPSGGAAIATATSRGVVLRCSIGRDVFTLWFSVIKPLKCANYSITLNVDIAYGLSMLFWNFYCSKYRYFGGL